MTPAKVVQGNQLSGAAMWSIRLVVPASSGLNHVLPVSSWSRKVAGRQSSKRSRRWRSSRSYAMRLTGGSGYEGAGIMVAMGTGAGRAMRAAAAAAVWQQGAAEPAAAAPTTRFRSRSRARPEGSGPKSPTETTYLLI